MRFPPAVAVLLAAAVVACSPGDKKSCPSGQEPCAGACVDPARYRTDAANCGGCGIACGTGTCAAGVCQCEGVTLCPGENPRCRDTQTDASSCGGCGIACGTGTCAGGVCQCEGVTLCDGQNPRCRDLQTDAASCGTCGNVCPLTNDVCIAGECHCPPTLTDVCGTTCVDLGSDEQHCGSCPNACAVGATCTARVCACPSGQTVCGTSPSACVDLETDPSNCNRCGNVCPRTDDVCVAGTCQCPASLPNVCGTTPETCVDLQSDEANCGTCTNACATGGTCTGGSCHCPAGPQLGCGGACCPGGDACCAGDTCQPAHSNGLGGSYYDCGAQNAWTLDQARRAADSWKAPGVETVDSVLICPNCLCRRTDTQAAVWCYAGSNLPGRVRMLDAASCDSACPFGDSSQWN